MHPLGDDVTDKPAYIPTSRPGRSSVHDPSHRNYLGILRTNRDVYRKSKMMKYYITLFCIMLSFFSLAQVIEGTVVDVTDNPLPYATVLLLQPVDSSLVKSTISKGDGTFLLRDIPSGNYTLKISNVGFQTYEETITASGGDLDLDNIVLQDAVQELTEVTVTAEKPIIEVRADKTVFNVENTINATNSSAFELLRKAPGIIIDNNGGIILEGKSGVQIFINDRLSVLQGDDLLVFLESLQASDIEAVEIITQPSSRYDAAGNAGIINIRLKKDKSLGTNGSFTGGVTVGDFARENVSLNFNSRGRKGNLYGTYSNRFGKRTGFINLLRTQFGTQFDARTTTIFDDNTNNIRLGYDYYASSKSTFGILLNGNFNNYHVDRSSRTPIYEVGTTTLDSVLVANNQTDGNSRNLNGNLNYRYRDTLGYVVNIDADYGKYESVRLLFQPNIYLDGNENEVLRENITIQDTPIDIDIATLKGDLELPILGGTTSTGFKLSSVNTVNTFDLFDRINGEDRLNEQRSNSFDYTESIYAAYVNYQAQLKKWNLQFGLRMEHTNSDGDLKSRDGFQDERVQRSYTNYFPSGGLTYQASRTSQWALTYSKRIQRPNYQSLNPFEYRIDELSFSKGNPFLQPQYTDNIKLAHTYKYTLNTSFSYSYISDFFARVTVAEGNNQNFLTTLNVADQEIISLGISYPKKLWEWWNIYVSLNAYSSKYKALSDEFLAVQQETLSLYAQNTFSLENGLRIEVSGWYSSPSVWGGTYQTNALGALNVAFQKKFMDDRFTARLAFNDILFTSPWAGTTRFGELFIDGSGGNDSRQVAFSLTYDFGSNEVKKARDRKTGLEEEADRIGE